MVRNLWAVTIFVAVVAGSTVHSGSEPARAVPGAGLPDAVPIDVAPSDVVSSESATTDIASGSSVWRVPILPGPAQSNRGVATGYDELHPGAAPAGSNDFTCTPTGQHPRPVVLAHGTDATSYRDFAALAPLLADDGYCVFALDYGGAAGADSFGTEDIATSAGQFGDFVDRVRAATGAYSVDVVGYSQGATVARYHVNRLGGAEHVHQWVGIASPSYGGVMYGLVPVLSAVPGGARFVEKVTSIAVAQQMQGSEFLTALNAGGDTVPGVRYTTIASRVDEMIQPHTNIALRGPGAVNLVLQDECPGNGSGHFQSVYDPYVLDLVRRALDPTAIPRVRCEFVPIGAGIPEVVLESNS